MNQSNSSLRRCASVLFLLLFIAVASVAAQSTAFTYQGRLADGAPSANGTYDLGFALFDAAAGGTQIGAAQTRAAVNVSNGAFTVSLDFGAAAFPGANRFLEIAVKRPSDANFTTLAPRQQITSTPYAIRALNAGTADTATTATSATTAAAATNAEQLGGVAAANYLQKSGSGASLTNLNAGSVTTGTLPDAALSANVARRDTANTLTGNQTINGNFAQTGTTTDLNLTNGFLARGTLDTGAIPIEGVGTRMMFYPGKAAFRAGYVNGTQWDDANIGYWSTAFGYNIRASGDYSFAAGRESVAANIDSIALGNYVTASGAACVAMGYYANCNTRQGSFVFSDRSVFDDGNTVTDESFKAVVNHSFNVRATGGYYLYTNTGVTTGLRLSHLLTTNTAYGSFVWTDRSSDAGIAPTGQNQTIFRSSGGFWLYSNSNASSGVQLLPGGGAWSSLSDRNMKENFKSVNSRDVLQRVLKLPISTWNYKTQAASIRHIGAMAQDFKAAFAVGESDTTISTIDPDGVAFAAIQGLNEDMTERTAKLQAENNALRLQIKAQQSEFEARFKRLEQSVNALRKSSRRNKK